MKQKKLLFIGSIANEKRHFDGETNKSTDVIKCFQKLTDAKISVINYSKNKYLQTLKLLLLVIFKKFNGIFISKGIVTGSFVLHLISKFGRSRNKDNIWFYLIGNGYQGFEDKPIYFEAIKSCKKVIVESPMVTESMKIKGINNCIIFPCLKNNYDIAFTQKTYSPKQPLHLIFFSRIDEHKGLSDLISVVINLNAKYGEGSFILDIAGGCTASKDYTDDVAAICSRHSFLNFYGDTFMIQGKESYLRLQQYDLHVFPSKFVQECAPGSVLDMFVAGVPTLTSSFPSVHFLMDEEDSYFFKQLDVADLETQLEKIYLDPSLLSIKREKSFNNRLKYTYEEFIAFLRRNGFLF